MLFSNYRADKIALSTRGPRVAFKRQRTLVHACEPGRLSPHATFTEKYFLLPWSTLLFGTLDELFVETVLASSTNDTGQNSDELPDSTDPFLINEEP